MHEMCWLCYIKRVKDPIIHTTMTTISPNSGMLQSLSSASPKICTALDHGEAKAHYNTLQDFSKLYL